MEYLGIHGDRKVYWWNYFEENFDTLPDGNWICFAMEEGLPQDELLEKFIRKSIQKKILEFKAYGKLSSKLDDRFDQIMVNMEVLEKCPEIDVMTTWHNNEGLASAFWQCFHATCLPDTTNFKDLKIVCFHFDNIDFRKEIKIYLKQFNEGWLPSNEE